MFKCIAVINGSLFKRQVSKCFAYQSASPDMCTVQPCMAHPIEAQIQHLCKLIAISQQPNHNNI